MMPGPPKLGKPGLPSSPSRLATLSVGVQKHDRVVHDPAIARPKFDGADHHVFVDRNRDDEAAIRCRARRRESRTARAIFKTMSGSPNCQPSENSGGLGRSLGSPSGAPAAAQLAIVAISARSRAAARPGTCRNRARPSREACDAPGDFGDEVGPLLGVLVVNSGKRTDLARPMAAAQFFHSSGAISLV